MLMLMLYISLMHEQDPEILKLPHLGQKEKHGLRLGSADSHQNRYTLSSACWRSRSDEVNRTTSCENNRELILRSPNRTLSTPCLCHRLEILENHKQNWCQMCLTSCWEYRRCSHSGYIKTGWLVAKAQYPIHLQYPPQNSLWDTYVSSKSTKHNVDLTGKLPWPLCWPTVQWPGRNPLLLLDLRFDNQNLLFSTLA